MEKQSTSLVQKLMLGVLVGILLCLVVIIAQNARNKAAEVRVRPEPKAFNTAWYKRPANPVSPAAPAPETPAVPPVRESDSARNTVIVDPSASPAAAPNPNANVLAAPGPVPVRNRSRDVATVGGVTRRLVGPVISGKIVLLGTPAPEKQISFGANSSTCGAVNPEGMKTRHYVASEKGELANVFVYVQAGLEGLRFPVPTEPAVITATKCSYEPYVSGAQVGQKVLFRNSDPFMHNLHVTSKINREFNNALPVPMTVERSFDKPEIFIRIKCDVHDWMFTYLAVLPHPFFAVSDEEGNYTFPAALPPGNYTVAARHLKAGELTQPIYVGVVQNTPLNFSFEVPER